MYSIRNRFLTLLLSSVQLLPLSNQLGQVKTGAAVAVGATAGAVGVTAIRGGAKQAAKTAFHMTDDAVGKGISASASKVSHYDSLGLLVSRGSHWDSFSSIASETSVGKGLSSEQLLARWRIDPIFRAKIFEEVEQTHPERLGTLTNDLLPRYRLPLILHHVNPRAGLASAVEREPVLLYDAAGNTISNSSQLWQSAESEYRTQAFKVFDEVLKDVPDDVLMSEEKLKNTLQKAFTTTAPKGKYSFDVTTGKLKLTYATTHGEFTGELNAYNIATAVAKLAAAGTAGALGPEIYRQVEKRIKRSDPLPE